MENLVKQYKEIERYAHIWFDDVMNKATQEVAELIEAQSQNDIAETQKEAKDALINILSISQDLWVLQETYSPKTTSLVDLAVSHWKWNSLVNSYRWKYSRQKVTLEQVRSSTKDLVGNILSFLPENTDLKEVVSSCISKFESRKELYKPQINLENFVDSYMDFPKKWINFRDVSPLLKNPEALKYACFELANSCLNADVIVWLDARGFIFWSLVAEILKKPFVMIRKAWKLPWDKQKISYWLEYWKDEIEIQKTSILPWQKVALIDDLLATWWTIKAAIDLVENVWWIVDTLWFVISLDDDFLKSFAWRKDIEKYNIKSLLSYND